KLAIDFDKRNREQAEPIKADLEKLISLSSFEKFNKQAADLFAKGYDLPFNIFVVKDMKDTYHNAGYAEVPGTFLPDTTAYQSEDAEKLLSTLEKQTVKLLVMAGVEEEQAETWARKGIEFDKKLAKVLKSTEEWADYAATYNPVKLADF